MAIKDLKTLKSAIRDFTNRGDIVITDELIEQFIGIAETDIYRRLRTPANEAFDRFTSAADGDSISISRDFIEFRLISVNRKPVYQLTMAEFYNGNHGFSRFGSKIVFNPSFKKGDVIDIVYYEDLSGTLKVGTDSNGVLAASPNVYLYTVLEQAFSYLQEPEMAAMYKMKGNDEIEKMNLQARHAELSGGKLAMSPSPYHNNLEHSYTSYKNK